MTKRMLIDATHAEETRVAVVDNGRLEEFDYESAFRKPLKGNIYLAKVTRVEPSLQAAFVNFGGNRHGFLPFSEIHPDYFRIPIADREALLAEQEEALREAEEEDEALDAEAAQENEEESKKEEEDGVEEIEDDKDEIEELGGEQALDEDEEAEKPSQSKSRSKSRLKGRGQNTHNDQQDQNDQGAASENEDDEDAIGNRIADEDIDDVNGNVRDDEEGDDAIGNRDQDNDRGGRHRGRGGRHRGRNGRGRGRRGMDSRRTQKFDDKIDPEQRFRFNLRRRYKIQEVIKRGQIMLVQVSKEERGNKGAAVGSYLSLPGRYCVLMPNSPRAGGVSRKISNYKDRAKMRDMMKELEVPKGMSVILRTAGVTRTKAEIKRDLDYLLKLWDNIRELTMESTAPALVYEEADLVKRSVRDHYTRELKEVVVAGKEGFETAKSFMKMLMPSHAKKVVEYTENVPLFNKYKIEKQISEIGETQVTLPSGGYLVINPTEALVSVDVNSGKATKERHIEETALRTNLEAAEEVARQLRLRDLGGLVVIDFIDMEDRRNNGKVERKMREALSGDRARIQMGRISSFGLMELSRQRLSPSLTESQFELCSHCHGVGRVRTADAASILVLRAIEDEGAKGRAAEIMVHVPSAVALYVLNYKRKNLADMEERYNVAIVMRVDEDLGASGFRVEVSKPISKEDEDDESSDGEEKASHSQSNRAENNHRSDNNDGDDNSDGKGRRRRGRRGGRKRGGRDRDEVSSRDNSAEGETAQADDAHDTPEKEDVEKMNSQPSSATKDDVKEDDKPKPKRAASKSKASSKKEEPQAKASENKDEKKPAAKKSSSKSTKAEPKDKKASSKAEDKKDEIKDDKKSADKTENTQSSQPSNDDKPQEKPYEVITEASDAAPKKKGWWNKLVD